MQNSGTHTTQHTTTIYLFILEGEIRIAILLYGHVRKYHHIFNNYSLVREQLIKGYARMDNKSDRRDRRHKEYFPNFFLKSEILELQM